MGCGKKYRFGSFEAHTVARELFKSGTRIKLRGQPYLVLEVLLDRAGEVVTRDEIREKLWSTDTFVDFEHGLNTSVKKLRQVLCDSAEEPRYIETVPRVGYRFIAPVQVVAEKAESPVDPPVFSAEDLGQAIISAAGLDSGNPRSREQSGSTAAKIAPHQLITRAGRWPSFLPRWLLGAGLLVILLGATYVRELWLDRARQTKRLIDKDTIVVLADFDNTTGEHLFDGTLKQAVLADLEQSPFLNVLSEQRVTGILRRMGRASNEKISEAVAMEICLRAGSTAVLGGSIASLGSHYAIALRALNCQTGDSIGIAKAEAAGREMILQALDSAVTSVREKLGESRTSIEKFNHALAEVTTSSLPALQAYTESIRVQQEHGDPEAIPLLERALELDPNFALAYARLGVAYSNLGQAGLAIDNLTKAFELRQRSSERESFYISTQYYTFVTGQVEKANQELRLWIQEYPRDFLAHFELGDNYALLGQYEKAVAETRESLRLEPNNVLPYGNLALFSLALNRMDDAETTFREARSRSLDDPYLRQNTYFLAFLKNDFPGMQQQVNWASGKPGAEALLLSDESQTQAYYGRIEKARALTRRAVDSAKRNDAKEAGALWQANEALWEAELGNAAKARAAAAAALSMSQGRDVRLLVALALAKSGDVARAPELAKKLDDDFPGSTILQDYWLPTIRAEIALNRNNAAEAIVLLQAAVPYELGLPPQFQVGTLYPVYVRGQACLRARQGSKSVEEFQKILDNRGILLNSPLAALARLQLGRSYLAIGDKEKARNLYQDFLTLWKDADPDIPILKQAKAEYASLQ